jgi:hypothetical protein
MIDFTLNDEPVNFILDADVVAGPDESARLLEDGGYRLLEDGSYRLLE